MRPPNLGWDLARPGIEGGAVGLGELEGGRDAGADADRLVERGGRALGRAGFPVRGIAPAEAEATWAEAATRDTREWRLQAKKRSVSSRQSTG